VDEMSDALHEYSTDWQDRLLGAPNHREGWGLGPASLPEHRTGTHHVTYELDLPDGRILRTRISHPPGRTTYGPSSLWAHVPRDQLQVSEGGVPGRRT
jgi:hypothetical protein